MDIEDIFTLFFDWGCSPKRKKRIVIIAACVLLAGIVAIFLCL